MKIEIKHQEEKTMHSFDVKNPDMLSYKEVSRICKAMNVKAILVNGKYYDFKNNS